MRVAAERRDRKCRHAEDALERHERERDREDRGGQDENDGGGVDGPDEQRQAEPGHARGAHVVDGDDEIRPVRMERKSGDEDAGDDERRRGRWIGGGVRACRRSSRCRRRRRSGRERESAAEDKEIPDSEVEPREGDIAGADHQGNQKIAEHGGDRGDQEKPDHDHAMKW